MRLELWLKKLNFWHFLNLGAPTIAGVFDCFLSSKTKNRISN